MKKHPVFKSIHVHHKLSDMAYPAPRRSVNLGSRKHKRELLELFCGYDTETTTVQTFDGWRSAVYSHQVSIANRDECHVLLLRTWDDFMDFMQAVADHYGISEERRIIFWVANLSFEFSFLAFRYTWGDFFAKEERQPLLATCLCGVEFREALAISGGNLAHLASTYCHTQKLVGDLDYKKLRNYHTYMSQDEKNYCINDVVILSEFSRYLFKEHIIKKRKVPMTKTGVLLDEMKTEFLRQSKKLDAYGAHKIAYENLIRRAFPEKGFYDVLFRYVFRGGYVHANALYADTDLQAVDMYDITSSYPYEMLCSYVPVTPFKETLFDENLTKKKCCILFAVFTDIRATTYHTIESKNKVIEAIGAKWDNGRLISADLLKVALTELDYVTYKDFYAWGKMEVATFLTADRGKLPRFFRDTLTKHYAVKNKLKKEGKQDTIEYKLAKEAVNSLYGACVKRIRLDKVTFDENGWATKKNERPYEKEVENKILLPQWGVWITASARRSLLSTVKKLDRAGVQVVYCDTDSVKYIVDAEAERIIRQVNVKREKRLKNRKYGYASLRGLGQFDKENRVPVRFKTCGAKRYIYSENGKVKVTVAGLPKQALDGYGADELFKIFTAYGFVVRAEQSLKLTTAYTDVPYSIYVDGVWMEEKSGVALYEIPFTMKVDDTYKQLVDDLKTVARVGYHL